jgi:Novel toxin 16
MPLYYLPDVPALPELFPGPMKYPECKVDGKKRPARDCELSILDKLSTAVDSLCKAGEMPKCDKESGLADAMYGWSWSESQCDAALAAIAVRVKCIAARNERDTRCFRGGDTGHRGQTAGHQRAANECIKKMKKNGCLNKTIPGFPVPDGA